MACKGTLTEAHYNSVWSKCLSPPIVSLQDTIVLGQGQT